MEKNSLLTHKKQMLCFNEDGACEVLFFYQNKNMTEVMTSFLIDMCIGKALAYENCIMS